MEGLRYTTIIEPAEPLARLSRRSRAKMDRRGSCLRYCRATTRQAARDRQATMRALLYTTVLLAMILIVGCSHSGDFGSFIVTQVTKYGGHTRTVGVIPTLHARWTVKQDANGFTAYASQVSFSAVDGFMHEVYGVPNISTDGNEGGGPRRVWGAVDIGVTIQLIGRKNDTEIICQRGAL